MNPSTIRGWGRVGETQSLKCVRGSWAEAAGELQFNLCYSSTLISFRKMAAFLTVTLQSKKGMYVCITIFTGFCKGAGNKTKWIHKPCHCTFCDFVVFIYSFVRSYFPFFKTSVIFPKLYSFSRAVKRTFWLLNPNRVEVFVRCQDSLLCLGALVLWRLSSCFPSVSFVLHLPPGRLSPVLHWPNPSAL